jgi:hypothetical protein
MAGMGCNGFMSSQPKHPKFRINNIQSTQTGTDPRISITGDNSKILRLGI